jgi:hypothetical protein
MAQKVITVYTDDLTGEESDEVQTHSFSLNGVSYEIDLTSDNYDKLADALKPFIAAGRKTSRPKAGRAVRRGASERPAAETVRAWAKTRGLVVSERGRIPSTILEAYSQAH